MAPFGTASPRLYAGRVPPSGIRISRVSGSVDDARVRMVFRRLVLLLGFGLLDLLQFYQRLLQALLVLTGPLLLRRELRVCGGLLDRLQMLARRLQMLLQGLFFLEAVHASAS